MAIGQPSRSQNADVSKFAKKKKLLNYLIHCQRDVESRCIYFTLTLTPGLI